jgi:hypothetical protein
MNAGHGFGQKFNIPLLIGRRIADGDEKSKASRMRKSATQSSQRFTRETDFSLA